MRVTFVGNFDVPFSTESHHAWTWRKMGHEVIQLQQNRTTEAQVLDACRQSQLFQFTHTHGWPCPVSMETVSQIRDMGVKSFSYHLDKYFGIGARQAGYLEHPSFHLDYFFSTDGGSERQWNAAGVNHHWISPGVVEYGAYLGAPNEQIDVLFTGSEHYHAEYPFRQHLVSSLRANYGNRFQVRQGVREAPLNTLYAGATVCVGDHIFAGTPYYWSDRLPESAGRGAFIIYPRTQGLEEYEKNGLITYEPQNAEDLIKKIDFFLDKSYECDRIERRNQLHEYVKHNHTYTQKLNQILTIMGLA